MPKKIMPGKERLEPVTVRVDPDELLLAREYKLDVAKICREALHREISKREGVCPTCGTKSKWETMK